VNCTIAENTAAHPDPAKAIGGISITGDVGQNGIAAIANSIIWHSSGKDILTAADGTGTLWIAYSDVKDTGISGTSLIHTDPQFYSPTDYHLTVSSPCKNTGSSVGTTLTGTKTTMYDIGYKNPPYNYPDASVTWNWGDGVHDLKAQWQYYASLSNSWGHPVGKFFGRNDSSCTADPSDEQTISNISTVDASSYAYTTNYGIGEYNYPTLPKQTIFWRGTNGYYGAWRIDGIAVTYSNPNYFGRLNVAWYFQTNGGPYFDAGIRTEDLEGKTRPNETYYDIGAYEYYVNTCATNLVNISGTTNYYTSLQTAYTAASDGQNILAQAITFTEPLTFGANIAITLKGGYNCGFTTVTGFTTVNGQLILSGGTVTIDSIIIG
jgi:hypothetical protein